MDFKVALLVDIPVTDEYQTAITKANGQFVQKVCKSDEETLAVAGDSDYVITVGHQCPFNRSLIEKLSKCRFLQTMGIGYDGIDVEAPTEQGITVHNVPEYCIEELSDHTIALIMACTRQIVRLNSAVKAGEFSVPLNERMGTLIEIWSKMDRLRGKTLGIVGFGRVGKMVAVKAKAFGMDIMVYDPYVAKIQEDQLGVKVVVMDQLLREADIISLNAALTKTSDHLIGQEQLKMMKRSAFIINTARGRLIDEEALYNALVSGVISGAGLDVSEPNPPTSDSPLYKLNNIILTGHSGHFSPTSFMDMRRRPLEDVLKVMHGELPQSLVNPEVKNRENVRGPIKLIL